MSSNLGSKRVDWSKVGAAFACTQKNLGAPGATVLIAKRDVLEKDPLDICPTVMSWKAKYNSSNQIFNTPDVASIYMMNLELEFQLSHGGIDYFEQESKRKSQFLYDLIDNSNGFYSNHIKGSY